MLTKDQIAKRIAKEVQDKYYVNLGKSMLFVVIVSMLSNF